MARLAFDLGDGDVASVRKKHIPRHSVEALPRNLLVLRGELADLLLLRAFRLGDRVAEQAGLHPGQPGEGLLFHLLMADRALQSLGFVLGMVELNRLADFRLKPPSNQHSSGKEEYQRHNNPDAPPHSMFPSSMCLWPLQKARMVPDFSRREKSN
jgi:hypothetical protein